jgi:hypothetical protein
MTIFPGDSGLQKIYGTAGIKPGEDPPKGAEAILGVPGVTPSAVATLQAMEVLKILLNRGRIFRNKMVHIDLENGQIDTFLFDQSEE